MSTSGAERLAIIGEHGYQPPREAHHRELDSIPDTSDGKKWTHIIAGESYLPQLENGVFQAASLDMYGSLREVLWKIAPWSKPQYLEALRERGAGDPFIHPILPDLNDEDKTTVIAAGRVAFQRETGVAPQWFWPPETALDLSTLDILVQQGYTGVLCAPEQIWTQTGGERDNQLVRVKTASGSILALPFDSQVSRNLAFDKKFNADHFFHQYIRPRLDRLPSHIPIVAWTDGETFGHHAKNADKFIAHLLLNTLPNNRVQTLSINQVTNAWNPRDIQQGYLHNRSAWSCPHGDLVRWHGSCPCSGSNSGEWKGAFYAALHKLNASITQLVRKHIGKSYQEKLIATFSQALNSTGENSTPTESLLSAKAASLTAVTSCGTFFENPHTSGHINVLFGLQALHHIRDAGLEREFHQLWAEFVQNLSFAGDPTGHLPNLGQLPDELLKKRDQAVHR